MGISRAAQHLKNYEKSWQSLRKAEALAGDAAELRNIALQSQGIASSLPPNYPKRAEMQSQADALARKSLAQGWSNPVALNLYYRMLETRNLREAENLLNPLEARRLATPDLYLGLAEAQLALSDKQGRGTLAAGPERDRIARNAARALAAGNPAIWPRLLHIFMRLNDR